VVSLGVTGALFGGVVCASAILKRNLMSAVGKRRGFGEGLVPASATS
jgi:hypothetical protein